MGEYLFKSNKDVEIKWNMELSNKIIQKEYPIVSRQRTHATTLKLTIIYLGRNIIIWIMYLLNKLVELHKFLSFSGTRIIQDHF